MLTQGLGVGLRGDQPLERWQIHHLMDKDIGSTRQLNEPWGWARITGNHDRTVWTVEPIGESRPNWRMINQAGGDGDILVSHNQARALELMDRDQVFKRRPALIGDAALNVVVVHLQKEPRHL